MHVLLQGLLSNSPQVRAMAAEGLSELGERAVRALLVSCVDTDARVRAAAAKALGLIGEPARVAKETLEILTQDDDENVRKEATRALRSIGGK